MSTPSPFEIFLVVPPGLEPVLAEEAHEAGFGPTRISPGGVTITGGWPEVWRANLVLRGATRVLVRIAEFRAFHLAQLDKRARKVDWAAVLRPDVPVRVLASCKASKIYHAGAAAQRIERAISDTLGAPVSADAQLQIKVRIDDNLCTVSLDSSGESLHKRGQKTLVGKAPLRETLAALCLRHCGYRGTEPVVDPMCGSGTIVLEAAGIASGLAPGHARAFAFESLASFDQTAWQEMRSAPNTPRSDHMAFGFDRDAGAIAGARGNADRAGLAARCRFDMRPIGALVAPDGPPGLVLVNPPYGARIGNKKALFALYGTLGQRLRDGFSGWRVGLVTTEGGLARATGLPFADPGPRVAHGGLKVQIFKTGRLH